ncbi:hypothetical protein KAR91_15065 [Candidatus Pacearchaeota archaeon]|nr:hypothetical protein [Candidatus Pacearchaeota archaeon]
MIGNGGPAGEQGPGFFSINKFGRNSDVDTGSVPEDIWSGGGLYPFIDPATPKVLEVLSDSGEDAVGGTGAHTVEFEILDGSGNKITETITLTGATPVDLAGGVLLSAFNRGTVLVSGSSESNVGILTVRDKVGGTVRGLIEAGEGQTLQAIYTHPVGSKGNIRRHWARLAKFPGTDAELRIVTRPFGGSWNTKETFSISEAVHHNVTYPPRTGIEIGPREQVRIEVFTVLANDAVISAGFDIEGEDE